MQLSAVKELGFLARFNEHRKTIIALLILFNAAAFFPFRYIGGMQDRDSYRMLLGMLDSLARGQHFTSPLLYNRQVSFGYYSLIYTLILPFGYSASTIIAVMNAISFAAAVLFVVPFFLVVERLFDRNTAIAASVILPAVPVWWNGALYGHPAMPGTLWFFCGLTAIACSITGRRPMFIRLLATVSMAAALSFRFDLVLLFPAVAAVICYKYQATARRIRETAFYVLGAVALFKLAQLALPAVQGGPTPDSIPVLLHRFQDPSRVFAFSRAAIVEPIVDVGGAFGPLLLILILPAFWMVLRRRNVPQILFTAGVIVPSLVFWFPNPGPVRHYLPIAPASAAAVAMTALWVLSKIVELPVRAISVAACGALVAAVCTAVSIGLHYAPGRASKFESPFWFRFTLDDYQQRASRLADDLLTLQGPKQPVLILCDSNFVIGRMEMSAPNLRVQLHRYHLANGVPFVFHEVDYDGRIFMMLEEPFYPFIVYPALDQQHLYPTYPVLLDPYNPLVAYDGPRLRAHLEKTSDGEQIEVDGVKRSQSEQAHVASTPQRAR